MNGELYNRVQISSLASLRAFWSSSRESQVYFKMMVLILHVEDYVLSTPVPTVWYSNTIGPRLLVY